MLGYRHAFHAGNHADVLKHLVLYHCLRYMTRKPKPLLYLDTHAGAGAYRLEEGYAAQNREWETGVGRLGARLPATPAPVEEYLRFTFEFGRERPGEFPGSPALASRLLRPGDRLVLRELHPADFEELASRFSGDPRAQVRREDGYSSLKSSLPPPSRRALTMVDPPYEVVSEYDRVVEALGEALGRFETGTYLVWYPLLERPEARSLPARLSALTERPRLSGELRVRGSSPGDRGLAGSGILVVNPPWPLESVLRSSLPFLAEALGQDSSSDWNLRIP